jgi:hypothetical protein
LVAVNHAFGQPGLFIGNNPGTSQGQNLDFSLLLADAYDEDSLAALSSNIDPGRVPAAVRYGFLHATAEYAWRGRRLTLRWTSTSSLRYYHNLDKLANISDTAALGLSTRLFGRTNLVVNQSATYSPSYLSELFPSAPPSEELGTAPSAAPDLSISSQESYTYRTTVELAQPLWSRTGVSATGEFSYTDYPQQENVLLRDLSNRALRASLSHRLTRSTEFTAGYRYGIGDLYSNSDTETSEQEIGLGLDYGRSFSATRRTVVAFRIGASRIDVPTVYIPGFETPAVDIQPPDTVAGGIVMGRLNRLSGDIGVRHEFYQFSRPWQVRFNYRRATEQIPNLTAPVFLDGVSAALEGLFTRRLDLLVAASYSSGGSTLYRADPTFDTYLGDARLRYALTRTLALFAQYLYYFYDFRENAQLAPGVPTRLERNGVRAGLMLRLPVLGR